MLACTHQKPSGKATTLVAAGSSSGDILTAGEWKPAAFLAYVDETQVDDAHFLQRALDDSEDEA